MKDRYLYVHVYHVRTVHLGSDLFLGGSGIKCLYRFFFLLVNTRQIFCTVETTFQIFFELLQEICPCTAYSAHMKNTRVRCHILYRRLNQRQNAFLCRWCTFCTQSSVDDVFLSVRRKKIDKILSILRPGGRSFGRRNP